MIVAPMRARLVVLAVLAASASPVPAQDRDGPGVSPADRGAIASCLRDSVDAPRACIGAIAVGCARDDDGDRRDVAVECSRREADAWRERLSFAARAAAERLDGGQRSRLAALQGSWETYAAQKCALAGELQPASRALVVQAACDLREVALRAIEMESLAVGRRQPAAEPRPRLER